MNLKIFIICGYCCFFLISSVKILNINDVKEGEVFNITIKNPPEFTGSKISVCWWVKTLYRANYDFLGSAGDETGLYLYDFYGSGKSLYFFFANSSRSQNIKFPNGHKIVPHAWTLLCLSFDNNEKTVVIHLNSKQVHKEVGIDEMDDNMLGNDFLGRNIRFQVDSYSGNLTGVRVYSDILTQDQVKSIYQCKPDYPSPDLIDWDEVEFDIKPETEDIELLDIPDSDGPCRDNVESIHSFQILAQMDKKRKAIRTCNAFGGEMNALTERDNIGNITDMSF